MRRSIPQKVRNLTAISRQSLSAEEIEPPRPNDRQISFTLIAQHARKAVRRLAQIAGSPRRRRQKLLVAEFNAFDGWFARSHPRPSLFGAFCPSERSLGAGQQRLVCEPYWPHSGNDLYWHEVCSALVGLVKYRQLLRPDDVVPLPTPRLCQINRQVSDQSLPVNLTRMAGRIVQGSRNLQTADQPSACAGDDSVQKIRTATAATLCQFMSSVWMNPLNQYKS